MTNVNKPRQSINCVVNLSGSKSISNRYLILKEVFNANWQFQNLSESEDTQLLQQALENIRQNQSAFIDVNHAGTDLRFLLALLATRPGQWTLTGSQRLKERPVGDLVNALVSLGADIEYCGEQGFPPLKITGKELSGSAVVIEAGISSQFISALLLIATSLKNGLQITLMGESVSAPYIQMSIELLRQQGVEVLEQEAAIQVLPSDSKERNESISIESDWSSASYWYSICALSNNSRIVLNGLQKNSLQADSVLPVLFEHLGVKTEYTANGVVLNQQPVSAKNFEYNFTHCPDIAQTLAVTCFGLGIEARLSGLKTLKIKETDRIFALKTELEKFGAQVSATNDSLHITHRAGFSFSKHPGIATYHDHRMAMSFAPLALVYNSVEIEQGEVVNKSYPAFWSDLKNAGFSVNLQP